MAPLRFAKATKEQSRLRLGLVGPTGSGKTFTALKLATALAEFRNGRIALIDSERGSASKYADQFDFDVLNLDSFSPLEYVEAIRAAEDAGYAVIVVDSLSHAWSGKDGALEQVDRVAARQASSGRNGNSFAAWREVTPLHNHFVDTMIRVNADLIGTLRTKMEYIIEEDERGRKTPRKVGLQPIQRDGMEYEFDVLADLTIEHACVISKTRCSAIDGKTYHKPGRDLADPLIAWIGSGATPTRRTSAHDTRAQDPADQPSPSPQHADAPKQSRPLYTKDHLEIWLRLYSNLGPFSSQTAPWLTALHGVA